MKAMKIYISLPISGQDMDMARDRALFAEGVIECRGHQAVNPFSVPSCEDTYASHMGADIAALLECDAMLALRGWTKSKGCRLEMHAAKIYGLRVFLSSAEIPNLKKIV